MASTDKTPYLQDTDFTLYQGEVLETLKTLPAESVHCVVTSPPYWGLRDYGTASWEGGDPDCDHLPPKQPERKFRNSRGEGIGDKYAGTNMTSWTERDGTTFRDVCGKCGARRVDQALGLEATPELYVERMVEVFREVRRVLRADGVCWVNLGDSYAADGPGAAYGWTNGKTSERDASTIAAYEHRSTQLPAKNLVGIPWRVAFALQADGWYLRSDVIWSKPNPMPESVTDRPTKSHEYVFLLTKSARYFFDQEAVREPAILGYRHSDGGFRGGGSYTNNRSYENSTKVEPAKPPTGYDESVGRNVRSVWEIATQPYPEAHFATYPEELVRRCILAGSSERGCCPECGAPWKRELGEAKIEPDRTQRSTAHYDTAERYGAGNGGNSGLDDLAARMREGVGRTTTGWRASCGHDHSPVPCMVLDPFGGSGTTALVARKHGRRSILIELSPEYCALAARRLQQLSLLSEVAEPSPALAPHKGLTGGALTLADKVERLREATTEAPMTRWAPANQCDVKGHAWEPADNLVMPTNPPKLRAICRLCGKREIVTARALQ